jgi:hypothetical protein
MKSQNPKWDAFKIDNKLRFSSKQRTHLFDKNLLIE